MGHNLTGLRSFDKLALDPRVEEIRAEGSDGYWVDLVPGWHYEDCITVHAYTVCDVLRAMQSVERMIKEQYLNAYGSIGL